MKFFDWLNDHPYGLFFGLVIILSLCKCSSGNTRMDTMKHEVEVEKAKDDLDTAIDCKVQVDPEKCKKAITKAKSTMDTGVKLAEKKDEVIEVTTTINVELEKKAKSWDTMWFYIYLAIGLVITACLLWVAWQFRFTIAKLLRLAGIPFPFFITPPQ